MQVAFKCLIGLAVLISPCVYDTDPREPSAVVALIADAGRAKAPEAFSATVVNRVGP